MKVNRTNDMVMDIASLVIHISKDINNCAKSIPSGPQYTIFSLNIESNNLIKQTEEKIQNIAIQLNSWINDGEVDKDVQITNLNDQLFKLTERFIRDIGVNYHRYKSYSKTNLPEPSDNSSATTVQECYSNNEQSQLIQDLEING